MQTKTDLDTWTFWRLGHRNTETQNLKKIENKKVFKNHIFIDSRNIPFLVYKCMCEGVQNVQLVQLLSRRG